MLTLLAFVLGALFANCLLFGAMMGDWERALGVSAINAVLLTACWLITGYPK